MKNLEQVVNELVKLLQELGPSAPVYILGADFVEAGVLDSVTTIRKLVTNDETAVVIE